MPKARFEGIYHELRRRIEQGAYAYQSFLPPESELTEEFGCSRNTVRRALSMLTDVAYVQPIHGKGVRVIWQKSTHGVEGSLEGVESFAEYAARNGMTPSTECKVFEHITCSESLAARSGFSVGDKLIRLIRVRSLDGKPRQIDHGYFLESEAHGLTPEIAEDSIYRYFEGTLGMKVLTSRRTVTVQLAGDEDCAYLDLGPYGCVAVMEGQSFNSEGIMFEYTHTRIHPEIFCYRMTSKR
ncbi:GntR family transcriptional regulator [Paratractidigestivibacter sp.]|uniref:GntR family transcriptional regulator n=1 Tax=Paratractidigestivibacter sp. TaxID=2847316 RepID=UPI002AC957EA|nr:UTRA domain-containing protein [Paratractidigestivibacter sp.]